MKHKKMITSAVCILLGLGGIHAQENTVAAGNEATGSGGTVSYSVGQIVYTTNTDTDGSVVQGVQQAYEIYTLGVSEVKIDLALSIYPNPTTDILNLKVDDTKDLTYQLYDLQGKLLDSKTITSSTTKINTDKLPSATYFVKILLRNNLVKAFKVIKK